MAATLEFITRISDYCFSHDINGRHSNLETPSSTFEEGNSRSLGLTDLVGDKIFDTTIDGWEWQVIQPEDFFNALSNYGIKPNNLEEQELIEKVLKMTGNWNHLYIIDNLIKILSSMLIFEHKPEDTKFLKYSELKGRDIRIINRIVHCCKENNIEDVKSLFKWIIYQQKVVSTKNSQKERVIELWTTEKFFQQLKKMNIIKSLEQEEELVNLLCLSQDKTDLIMMDKLDKIINPFQKSRYFKRFGLKARRKNNQKSLLIENSSKE